MCFWTQNHLANYDNSVICCNTELLQVKVHPVISLLLALLTKLFTLADLGDVRGQPPLPPSKGPDSFVLTYKIFET